MNIGMNLLLYFVHAKLIYFILEKNFIFFSFKLLKEGQSRKIIEKEVLETETFLNQKFEKPF